MRVRRCLIGIALFALPLLAQEGREAGKPNLEIWKWANFAILAALLGYFAVKQGGPALARRAKEIRDDLAAGERAKAEADARAGEVEARLANLGSEVAALRTSALVEREREATRIRHEFEREIARIQQQSEMEIESTGKMARIELQRFAARLAVDLAERKIRARMTPDVQSSLLQGFLADFKATQSSGQGNLDKPHAS